MRDAALTEFSAEIRSYYERGREEQRLMDPSHPGPLEFERTIELLTRLLPQRPARVLDVGGGPGRYAAWLRERGDEVVLIDPVALHVQQASERSIEAKLGDARDLSEPDASFDVVLLMGPLYHLTERDDRVRALTEARRVLRPGGLVVATAIGRFAALLDLLVNHDRLHEPGVFDCVEESVRSGVFRGHDHGLFTTAFFHLPAQLESEVKEGGFSSCELFNVEGPGFLAADFSTRWDDPERREIVLRAARLVERQSEMLGAASHLMAVGRKTAN